MTRTNGFNPAARRLPAFAHASREPRGSITTKYRRDQGDPEAGRSSLGLSQTASTTP